MMTTEQKWDYLEELLGNADMAAVNMLTNYNGLNHETLDYVAQEFGIEWEEDEDDA